MAVFTTVQSTAHMAHEPTDVNLSTNRDRTAQASGTGPARLYCAFRGKIQEPKTKTDYGSNRQAVSQVGNFGSSTGCEDYRDGEGDEPGTQPTNCPPGRPDSMKQGSHWSVTH